MVIFRHGKGGGMAYFGGSGTSNSQLLRFTPFLSATIAFTGVEATAQTKVGRSGRIVLFFFNSTINSKTAGNSIFACRRNSVTVPNTTITVPFGTVAQFDTGDISEEFLKDDLMCTFNDNTGQVSGGITGCLFGTVINS